jgi:hypothetical protein
MRVVATWLRSTWAPTVFCPSSGKGFGASKHVVSTKATAHAVASTGGMSMRGPSRAAPSAPGLSLTGVRLIIPDHALGLPVLRLRVVGEAVAPLLGIKIVANSTLMFGMNPLVLRNFYSTSCAIIPW